ncbi:MAG: hypothetical protein HGA38_00350 [Candidatus Moranbacteria bacterium]|nr:hypothetical protein [Candidatus Moranbacteria bacterium]NTW45986.1 hypothetical protein [Candidatus Moranbacteria bacterium]
MNYSGIPTSPHITVAISRDEFESAVRATELRRLLLARNDKRAILRLPKSKSEHGLFIVPEPLRGKLQRISYPERFRDADRSVIVVCGPSGQKLNPYWLQETGKNCDIQGWCSSAHSIITVTRRGSGMIEIVQRSIGAHLTGDLVFLRKRAVAEGPENFQSWIPKPFADAVMAVKYKAALNDRTMPYYLGNPNRQQEVRQ